METFTVTSSASEQRRQLPYNSLRDSHLAKYFSKPCNRQRLESAGLIRSNGEIVPEATIYEEGFKKDQQRRTQEAIFRSLESRKDDLERSHQAHCLRTLDEIEKIERVRRIRSERKESIEIGEEPVEYSTISPYVCHHPVQSAAKTCWTMRRPLSGKNELPPYLEPQRSSESSWLVAPKNRSQRKSGRGRRLQRNNKSANFKRSLQPFIPPERNEDEGKLVLLTMKYFGDGLYLESDHADPRDEILIEQQHCGGNTVYVFKDKLLPGTEFSFPSYRHPGYPFSLSLYVNGRYDGRLSVCCEYRHKLNSRLGGKTGRFAVVRVKGGSPCFRCLMKHNTPKRRMKSSKNKEQDQHRSSNSERDSEQENTLSVYNPSEKNRFDVPVSDEDEDKEFGNFDKRTSEIQSPDSMRGRNSAAGKTKPKGDGKGREKDGYNHYLYDIKVPVDDCDDADDNGKTAGPSGRTSASNSPGRRKQEKKDSPSQQKTVLHSVKSDTESEKDSQEELDKAKPKSSRSQRDSSDDESDYTGS